MELFSNPEFWVGVGFALVIALFIYLGVPGLVGKMLDTRAAAIAKELDDARALREQAEALLKDYRRKLQQAQAEVDAIMKEAKSEAERFAIESRVQLKAQAERRAKAAEEKIAMAEAQAVAELRALAADTAIAAAEKLIAARLDDKRATDLIKHSLEEIPSKLN
jgi:F-type H+-transporting ATPase subunit b